MNRSCHILALLLALFACGASDNSAPIPEIVKFQSGDVTLEGTLNLPGSDDHYPVVVFVHGSGMRTRDDFRVFVHQFNQAGVATFRYDKRGVGNSGGTYSDVGTMNSERMFRILASDAVGAINHLKKDSRIDPKRIIVAGVSQAGWIIPEINTLTEVFLSVCMSGPVVSVGEEIYYSELAERGAFSQAEADSMLQYFHGPRGFVPASRVLKMKGPSLWLFGGKDVSIPVKRSIALLDSLRSANALPVEMKIYPEADHSLCNRSTGRGEDYIPVVVDWVKGKL